MADYRGWLFLFRLPIAQDGAALLGCNLGVKLHAIHRESLVTECLNYTAF